MSLGNRVQFAVRSEKSNTGYNDKLFWSTLWEGELAPGQPGPMGLRLPLAAIPTMQAADLHDRDNAATQFGASPKLSERGWLGALEKAFKPR